MSRFGIRDHRKLLICDEKVAFVGGFNIAREYEGDGVTCGWCDLGLKIAGTLVKDLAASFDEMFDRALMPQPPFVRLHKSTAKRTVRARSFTSLICRTVRIMVRTSSVPTTPLTKAIDARRSAEPL